MPQVWGIDKHAIWSKPPISNYEIYTGVADVFWDDTTHYVATVPTGKIWWLWGGYQDGDANATIVGSIKDAANTLLFPILSEADARVGYAYPDPALMSVNMPLPMLAGWYLELLYGAAQGAGAYASCVVTEVDAIA